MTEELVISALRQAISTGLIAANAIIHMDSGFAKCGGRVSGVAGATQISAVNVGQRQS